MRRHKGEGSVYWSETRQRWVAQLDLGFDANGTRRKWRRLRKRRGDAVDALQQLRRQHDRQQSPDAGRQTLAQYLDSWCVGLEGVRAPKTLAAYRSDCAHVKELIGHVKLDKVQPQHVRTMLGRLPGRGLAPKSVLNVRTTLHTAFAQAVSDRLLDWNPVSVVDRPRVQRYDAIPLTLDDSRLLLDALEDDRLGALWTVAVAVGLRLGEALGLTWPRVDLDAGIIRVRQQLRHEGPTRNRHYVLRDLKNPKRIRDVPLPDVAIESLHKHRRRQAQEQLAAPGWVDGCCAECGGTGWGLLFTTNSRQSHGRALHETVARNAFQQVCEDAIGRRPRVHDLRHTAATLLMAKGVPLPVVQDVLGHSSIQVTKDLYGHLDVEHLRGASAAMDAMLRR